MSTELFFSDSMYDAQFARTLSNSYAGLADLGEAFAAAREVGRADPDRWFDAWHALAVRVESLAGSLTDPISRAQALLRASEYHRQSYFFLRHDLSDPRLTQGYTRHSETFETAIPRLAVHSELLRIPFGSARLRAFFWAPDTSGRRRPTIIFPSGYDSSAEDGWAYARAALERGYNVLSFEGPGQGGSLYVDGLFLRADFEAVLEPVVDALVARDDVDDERIVLIGRSFAGYLAARAATAEHRLAALVCDPAQPDMAEHLPRGIMGRVAAPLATAESSISKNKREFFGARMAAHGIDDIGDYFDELREFTMLDRATDIQCPTLIVECEGDFAGGGGATLASALTAPHELVHLTAAEGAGGHCAGLGQRVWDGVVYGWLARTLDRAEHT